MHRITRTIISTLLVSLLVVSLFADEHKKLCIIYFVQPNSENTILENDASSVFQSNSLIKPLHITGEQQHCQNDSIKEITKSLDAKQIPYVVWHHVIPNGEQIKVETPTHLYTTDPTQSPLGETQPTVGETFVSPVSPIIQAWQRAQGDEDARGEGYQFLVGGSVVLNSLLPPV